MKENTKTAPQEVEHKLPEAVKHIVVFHITETFADAVKEVSELKDVLQCEINAQQNGKFLYRATCSFQ